MAGTKNRVFFPQAALDAWLMAGQVDLVDGELTLLAEGRRFHLVEAARILREVSGAQDPHDLVGRAKPRVDLEGLGAEIVETSMLIGDAAYDIEPGWVGVAIDRSPAPDGRPDEDVLAMLLARDG